MLGRDQFWGSLFKGYRSVYLGDHPIKSTLPIRGNKAVTYPDKRALGLVIHQFKTLAAKCLWLF